MALGTVIDMPTAQALLDTLAANFNGGTVVLYDGTKPAGPATAISAQNVLATVTLNATAFAAATNGGASASAVLNPIASATISASGTPTWARWKSSAGTARMDVTVGGSGNNLVLTPTTLSAGGTLTMSYTMTLPVAGA